MQIHIFQYQDHDVHTVQWSERYLVGNSKLSPPRRSNNKQQAILQTSSFLCWGPQHKRESKSSNPTRSKFFCIKISQWKKSYSICRKRGARRAYIGVVPTMNVLCSSTMHSCWWYYVHVNLTRGISRGTKFNSVCVCLYMILYLCTNSMVKILLIKQFNRCNRCACLPFYTN